MQPYIDVIKTNIIEFSKKLSTKGFDARFGAIGYRDSVDSKIAFSTPESLSLQLAPWSAQGGGEVQEAGQLGIHAALDVFAADVVSTPGRAMADKVILFVTDAVSYKGNNKTDFSIDELASRMSSLRTSSLPKLKFFHSACATPRALGSKANSCGVATGGQLPRDQINNLVTTSKVMGKGFDFPLTGDIFLEQFSAEFSNTDVEESLMCVVTDALVLSSSGAEVGVFKTKDITEAIEKSSQSLAKLPLTLGPGSYKVTGTRCCVSKTNVAPTACKKQETILQNFSVVQKID